MPSLAPIVLFTYNRLKNTRETVACLRSCPEAADSDLIVFSDAPKDGRAAASVGEVRRFLHAIEGFRTVTVVERPENYGLFRNITEGVTQVVGKYGRVIVMEDDHSVSRFFLQYMNEGLDLLADREDIVSLHGYVYPHREPLPEAFLIKGADCWGWATWKRGWDLFNPDAASLLSAIKGQGRQQEFDFGGTYPYLHMLEEQAAGRANSWAICWYASAFLQDKYTVYPGESLVRINSLTDSGEHSTPSAFLQAFAVPERLVPLDWTKASLEAESAEGRRAFTLFFKSLRSWKSRLRRLFSNAYLKMKHR